MRRRDPFTRHARSHGMIEVNATPLIDVVMCLIVFYLIVGRMAADQLTPLLLPKSALGSTETEPRVLIINVVPVDGAAGEIAWRESNARVIVEGVAIADAPALAVTIASRASQDESTAVQIRADRRLPFGAVDPVLRACAASGPGGRSRAVQIIAEQGQPSGGTGEGGGAR
jgi:biopolymer transport protein ExbD